MTSPVSTEVSPSERVLIVDDETDLHELLEFNLRAVGFEVTCQSTANEAFAVARELRPAVTVLDVMLPDLSGIELCRRLRADPELAEIGVLMLTARTDEFDRVLGLEAGADDYVVKPFSVREVVLRVQALVRRCGERKVARQTASSGRRLAWRNLELDPVGHRVWVEGQELGLRPMEFRLLALLLEHPAKVFTRAELLERVWGIRADVHTRTVDVHVRRLRERLGRCGAAVQTVQGIGYRLSAP